jgi:hypothetical protein
MGLQAFCALKDSKKQRRELFKMKTSTRLSGLFIIASCLLCAAASISTFPSLPFHQQRLIERSEL